MSTWGLYWSSGVKINPILIGHQPYSRIQHAWIVLQYSQSKSLPNRRLHEIKHLGLIILEKEKFTSGRWLLLNYQSALECQISQSVSEWCMLTMYALGLTGKKTLPDPPVDGISVLVESPYGFFISSSWSSVKPFLTWMACSRLLSRR